jgi:hypothetical protein
MPEPVYRRDNSAIRTFYDDNPTGPSADEVKDSQLPIHELRGIATDLVRAVKQHAANETMIKLLEKGAEFIGSEKLIRAVNFVGKANVYVSAIYEGTVGAFELSVVKPLERGEALGRGLTSDQARFAGAMVAHLADPTLLPRGYLESQRAQVIAPGTFNKSEPVKLAAQITTDIAKGDPEAIAFRDALVSSVRAGLDAAHQRHIDSQESLDKLKEQDSQFRTVYETDPGFQIGVRAGLWQAKAHPADFARAERETGENAAAIQLARGA